MPRDQINPEKVLKTGALISFGNLFMSPFYPRLGTFASLTLTAAALFGLHEVGRRQQSGGFWGFFSSKSDANISDMNTSIQRVVEGGATVFDHVFPPGKR
ncbi:hypothetical protein [Legionella cincinnatiensis]|uniref:Uncharacterized protein n=1 Tax=Legionella cincinnatiensis TaxID=28085 RepID=A0A378ILK2_9GAMM|nr:hypothetical protein [Legionella cincinnatiensis]KTC82999.1 hypothetical protein Lcin_2371 [Legionella cincinnatiensis]STX35810.1 Uncharacterised protein [Legionella cincinnatiensis]